MLNIQDNCSDRIMRIFVVSYKRKMFEWVWVFVSVFGLPSLLVQANLGFKGCCWEGCDKVYMEGDKVKEWDKVTFIIAGFGARCHRF